MIPIWMYFRRSGGARPPGFAIGQFYPGTGAAFAGLTSTAWVADSAYRQRGPVENACGR